MISFIPIFTVINEIIAVIIDNAAALMRLFIQISLQAPIIAIEAVMILKILSEQSHFCFYYSDVKTTNILITQEWEAKLCDFSFTCHEESSSKNSFVYGTTEFMSPEISLATDFTISADIFSFGIVLCEVFKLVFLFSCIINVSISFINIVKSRHYRS